MEEYRDLAITVEVFKKIDMEEYRDLAITVEVFKKTLDKEEFKDFLKRL